MSENLEKDETIKSSRKILWRLIREELPRHKGRLSLAIICMIIAALTTSATAYLIDPAIKEIFLHKNVELLYSIPTVIVAVSVLRGLSTYGQSYIMGAIGTRIVNNLQIRMLKKLLYVDLSYFSKSHSGEIVSQFINDANNMRDTATTVVVAGFKDALTLIGCAGIMFYQDFTLATLTLFIFFPIVVFIKRLIKKTTKSAIMIYKYTGSVSSALSEIVRGMRIVRVYCREEYELNRIKMMFETRLHYLLKEIKARSASSPITEAITGVGIAVAILYAGYQGIGGKMEINNFMAFFTSMMMAYQPGRALSGLATKIQSGLVACHRVYSIIDLPIGLKETDNMSTLDACKGRIVFKNVSFSYKNNDDYILKDINLEIKAGQKIALVGSSGGGKSTLLNLIPRFYDVSKGHITIDKIDIKKIAPSSLRDSISLVSQDAFLFDGTIKENIMYGRLDATPEDYKKASIRAAAYDFIQELPDKDNTRVGESGMLLSGGQKQRIAIARAFLKDAPIILLDEATSALDNHSENIVRHALEELTHGKTSITIAHRLSTIIHSDIIFVIEHGEVIEQGNHETLLQNHSHYANLYRQSAQASL